MIKFEIEHYWDGDDVSQEHRPLLTISTDDGPEQPIMTITVDAPYYNNAPPVKSDDACICLWDFEVVEIFIKGRMDKYIEIEMNPHGEFLILAMDGHKQCFHESLKPLKFEAKISENRWNAVLVIPFSYLPPPLICPTCPLFCFNAFAMHNEPTGERKHLAHFAASAESGYDEPDFHRLHLFEGLPLAVTRNFFDNKPEIFAAQSPIWSERLGADFMDSARFQSVEW